MTSSSIHDIFVLSDNEAIYESPDCSPDELRSDSMGRFWLNRCKQTNIPVDTKAAWIQNERMDVSSINVNYDEANS